MNKWNNVLNMNNVPKELLLNSSLNCTCLLKTMANTKEEPQDKEELSMLSNDDVDTIDLEHQRTLTVIKKKRINSRCMVIIIIAIIVIVSMILIIYFATIGSHDTMSNIIDENCLIYSDGCNSCYCIDENESPYNITGLQCGDTTACDCGAYICTKVYCNSKEESSCTKCRHVHSSNCFTNPIYILS